MSLDLITSNSITKF